MKGPTSGRSQPPTEAGGSLTLEAQGRVGAASTTTGRVGTARRPGSGKQDGKVYELQKPAVEPPQGREPARNLVDLGRSAVHVRRPGDGRLDVGGKRPARGHGEGLRRSRGEAAGEKLGADPVNRSVVNVGTPAGLSSVLSRQDEAGKARRQPTARRGDGAPVVVRGRENRPHGEGGQRVRSPWAGTPGGHR